MATTAKNCYLLVNGKKHGPVSEQDIQSLYAQNKINGDTKFARAGMKEWIPLSKAGIIKSGMAGSGLTAQVIAAGRDIAKKAAPVASAAKHEVVHNIAPKVKATGNEVVDKLSKQEVVGKIAKNEVVSKIVDNQAAMKISKNKNKRVVLVGLMAVVAAVAIFIMLPGGGGGGSRSESGGGNAGDGGSANSDTINEGANSRIFPSPDNVQEYFEKNFEYKIGAISVVASFESPGLATLLGHALQKGLAGNNPNTNLPTHVYQVTIIGIVNGETPTFQYLAFTTGEIYEYDEFIKAIS